MTDHLEDALQRVVASWRDARGELPRIGWEPDVDPKIYVGEKSQSGWIQWQPMRMEPGPPLAELAPDLAPFHPSIEEYFGKWWFMALEGKLDDRMLSLRPNRPGLDPEAYLEIVRQYAAGKDRPLKLVPIGIDNRSTLTVVIDNQSGEVFIEDWETGELDPIALSLDDLFQRLDV